MSLRIAKGLELPETINGDLNLWGLETVEGLKLPKTVNGVLNLFSLETLDDLILPERFQKITLANNVVVTPENVHEYVNESKTK